MNHIEKLFELLEKATSQFHAVSATKAELLEIAKEILPKDTKYKIKKSFFMKTVSHIYEVQ